jgi:HD-like signal output (HDOD) protein
MNPAGSYSVLFVDEDPRVLQGLRRMLHAESRDWRMHFAGSGREAWTYLEREPFDAVVTEWRVADMDAAALLAGVMERHPQAARIVLSAEINPEASLKAVRCAHQFLAKPCDAGALKAALASACVLNRLIRENHLKALLAQLETLPSQPELYAHVLAEIQSPNPSFRRVGEVIARDAGMTAKILQLVNSAFFGLARRIGSPQEAVALLGYDTVKALVLSAKIFSQFDQRRMNRLGLEELWRHSLTAAMCARTIGTVENLSCKALDEAFAAGILHDVGKLVLAQNFPERYAEVLKRAQAPGSRLWEMEAECFGASHAELGAYLMGLWGLGEEVVNPIAYHHRPPQTMPRGPVTALVYSGNALEHLLAADTGDAPPVSVDPEVLGRLGIADRFPAWEQRCRQLRKEEFVHAN